MCTTRYCLILKGIMYNCFCQALGRVQGRAQVIQSDQSDYELNNTINLI